MTNMASKLLISMWSFGRKSLWKRLEMLIDLKFLIIAQVGVYDRCMYTQVNNLTANSPFTEITNVGTS